MHRRFYFPFESIILILLLLAVQTVLYGQKNAENLSGSLSSASSRAEGIRSVDAWIASGAAEENGTGQWLVVRVEMAAGFHLYSMNQQRGGYPTRITATAKELVSQKEVISVRMEGFHSPTPIETVQFMGDVLEKMKGTLFFLAPISFDTKNPLNETARQALLRELRIDVTLDALSCNDGDGGACYRVDETFTAQYDPNFSLEPLLAELKSMPKEDTKANSIVPTLTTSVPFSGRLLLYAFLGGLILNVMPCVLPVIGLKIVSFFEQAGQSRAHAFWLNLWYMFGILVVFSILALMSVGLSHLFTYGLFQIIMGAIVFVMALNLMGVWELALPGFLGGRRSNELMQKEGAPGAFFKGIITTLLAIPCGAPLLSPALVWTDAMTRQGETLLVLWVYLVIGLGMASPYLLIGAFPELLRFLPKPGLWMETFRNIMGFVLLTAVLWILFSMPVILILPMIALLFGLWFGCWWIGRLPFDASSQQRRRTWLLSLFILLLTIFFSFNIKGLENPYTLQNAIHAKMLRWAVRAERSGLLSQRHWQLFEPKLFESSLQEGKTVLIDFTADWCTNCKVLESTVLHTEAIETILEQKGIVSMTADCTHQNDDSEENRMINSLLDRFGGRQVPTVMLFSPKQPDQPKVLRGLFSLASLKNILDETGESKIKKENR